jgi:hypothetical protein
MNLDYHVMNLIHRIFFRLIISQYHIALLQNVYAHISGVMTAFALKEILNREALTITGIVNDFFPFRWNHRTENLGTDKSIFFV